MCVSVQIVFHADLIEKGRLAKCELPKHLTQEERKASWKHNKIQTNLANTLARDSKADNSKIAIDRSVNASSASVKNKVAVNRAAVAVNRVAVNRAAVSKGDDKTGSLGIRKRREATPAVFLCLLAVQSRCGVKLGKDGRLQM